MSKRKSKRKRVALAAGASGLTWAAASSGWAGTVTVRTVAVSGTPITAVGAMSSGETITAFGTVSINAAGQTAFTAVDAFNGSNANTNNTGQNAYTLFSEGPGTLTILARAATSAPGTGTAAVPTTSSGTFATFNNGQGSFVPTIDNSGDTLTYATLKFTSNGGTTDSSGNQISTNNFTGFYLYNNRSVGSLQVQLGATVATGSTTHSTLTSLAGYYLAANGGPLQIISLIPVVDPTGQFATTVAVADTTTAQSGILTNRSGTPAFVAVGGQLAPTGGTAAAPTFTAGVTYNGSSFAYAPSINASGETAFRGGLVGTSIAAANNAAIFSESGGVGTVHLVAQSGSQVPGLTAGDAYGTTFCNNPGFNNAGQTAFLCNLANNAALGTGDVVTTSNGNGGNGGLTNAGVFVEQNGSVRLVSQRGSAAPGTPSGVVYGGFAGSPVVDHGGQVAFDANLANASNGVGGVVASGLVGANGTGLFSEGLTPGVPTLVARTGMAAPGATGDVFATLDNNFALNAAGELLFSGSLVLSGTTTTDGRGVFAQDPTGAVNLIVRTGQTLPGAAAGSPTITSIVTTLTLSGGEDGRASTWNDSGTVPLDLTFSDGSSGIFDFTVAAPEPGSALLMGVPATALLGRRRRHRRSTSAG